MTIDARVFIRGSVDVVWSVLTDIDAAADTITGIDQVEILKRPDSGLVGLRWRETRTLFGKSATEEMWITAAVENEYYCVRAESHGSVYNSTLSMAEQDDGVLVTMTHETLPQSLVAKLLSVPMGLVMRGGMRKLLQQDLEDIKAAAEERAGCLDV